MHYNEHPESARKFSQINLMNDYQKGKELPCIAELPNWVEGTAFLYIHEYGGFTLECLASSNTCCERADGSSKLIIDPCGQSPYVQGPLYTGIVTDWQYITSYIDEETGLTVDRYHGTE